MNDINNQSDYWNKVAAQKTFTHPLDIDLLKSHVQKKDHILDYGCGYGRLTAEIFNQGFTNISGVDTSVELIERGKHLHPGIKLIAIENGHTIPVENESIDAIILFAVLTCIPSNEGQKQLMGGLFEKLKNGGIIYISDYYLQDNRHEVSAYKYYNNNPLNYGVFSLEEGATFRHHSKAWIHFLLKDFAIETELEVEVKSMNGHTAKAFQIIARKPINRAALA